MRNDELEERIYDHYDDIEDIVLSGIHIGMEGGFNLSLYDALFFLYLIQQETQLAIANLEVEGF